MERIYSTADAVYAFLATEWWKAFSAELSAALVALLIGIPLGLGIDRMIRERGQNASRIALIQMVEKSVEHTMEQARKLIETQDPTGQYLVPIGAFDVIALDSSVPQRFDLLPSSLNERIESFRLIANSLTVTVKILQEMLANHDSLPTSAVMVEDEMIGFATDILGHAPALPDALREDRIALE